MCDILQFPVRITTTGGGSIEGPANDNFLGFRPYLWAIPAIIIMTSIMAASWMCVVIYVNESKSLGT